MWTALDVQTGSHQRDKRLKSLTSATEGDHIKLFTFRDEMSESAHLMEIPRLRRHLKATVINLEEVKY